MSFGAGTVHLLSIRFDDKHKAGCLSGLCDFCPLGGTRCPFNIRARGTTTLFNFSPRPPSFARWLMGPTAKYAFAVTIAPFNAKMIHRLLLRSLSITTSKPELRI